ncbi:MazE superfamily protein [Saline Natrinema sp. J7-1 virus 1]|uniref:MazE superfamily protein n=1 Tax=Saline Natrinema sp. J7-1 virus 1 TaxID=2847285 RepID=A0AAE9VSC7_9VIRU|nr:MazE superfamily protein [Saline Natrinema sp. J7-1 virus 1]WBE14038.1 MazE superfamily protein [Saline Natrinema sp. J7-1 virus 1]
MQMALDIDPNESTVKAQRAIRSSGNSNILSIPPQMMQLMDWEEDDELEMVGNWEEGEITLRKAGTDEE